MPGQARAGQLNVNHLQELDIGLIRDLVDAINQDVRQPGKQLDQGDSRIALVESVHSGVYAGMRRRNSFTRSR